MTGLRNLKQGSIRKALEFYNRGLLQEAYRWIELVAENDLFKLKHEEALMIADLYYTMGKVEFSRNDYKKAIKAFNKSHKLRSENLLLSERIRLLRGLLASSSDEIKEKMDYDSFCVKLGVISQKCRKEANLSYIKHLVCLSIINPSSYQLPVDGTFITVLFLGAYRPLQRDDKWSLIIRSFKENPDKAYTEALSKVLSEYLLRYKDVTCDVDLITPVPPNPAKYVNRGFAPTDLLAECLSKEVAIPHQKDLSRTVSENTRDASEKEIETWYSIQSSGIKYIRGNHILLMDDVSTRGYTLRACCKVLLNSKARKVTGLILGRTGG